MSELKQRGLATVAEPGRRIVKQELQGDGSALPWVDAAKFARRAIMMSRADVEAASAHDGWVFFDRGLIDAAIALEHLTGAPAATTVGGLRFHHHVFLTPPWPEIYVTDTERPHDFAAAVAEYERLRMAYPELGYRTVVLPRVGVAARADLVLQTLGDLSLRP